jgi:hypothetical protein
LSKPRVMAPKANIRPMHEANNRCWHIIAPAGHTLDDVLSPAYLAPRIKDMIDGDELTLRSEDHKFHVRAYVLETDKDANTISFAVLEVSDLTSMPTIAYDYADAIVRREAGGWAVLSADVQLKGGFPTETAATAWVAEKRTAATAAMAGKVS